MANLLPFNLPILDWLQAFFARLGLVGSIAVPMGITAVAVVLYFAVKNVKTSNKIAKPEIKKSPDTEGMEMEGLSEEQRASMGAPTDHLEAENEDMRRALSTDGLPQGISIKPPTLKFNGDDDENQKMIDSSFAYYVSVALVNSAPSARIHTEVKSKYGQIRTVDETRPADLKAQLKEAIREVNEEAEKEEKMTTAPAEPQAPAPIEEEEQVEEPVT